MAGPPKLNFFLNENVEISSIDKGLLCGNYELISTKFSELFLLSGEHKVG